MRWKTTRSRPACASPASRTRSAIASSWTSTPCDGWVDNAGQTGGKEMRARSGWGVWLTLIAWAAWAMPAAAAVGVEVVSSRADQVTGGDALVRVTGPSSVRVRVGNRDVTGELSDGVGRIAGLQDGENVLTATLPDGSGRRMTLTNHPLQGPLFSGPQVWPWACNAGAKDASCTREPSYQYVYMPVALNGLPDPADVPQNATGDPRFAPYDPASPPPDVAQTTTDDGRKVPFIVRIETGTINRGQYKIAALYDPARKQAVWNRKMLLLGGPNCGVSYQEGAARDPMFAKALRRGMATVTASLMMTGNNCNLVTQAETVAMTKEHLVEAYGPVRFTMGLGGSGEALVQQWIANAYPGIYDGLIVEASFPDGATPLRKALDCGLLLQYWSDPSRWAPGVSWSPAEQSFLQGGEAPSACAAWKAFEPVFTPADESGQIPADQVYDPASRPCGVRSDIWDYSVSQFGRRPASDWTAGEKGCGRGFARQPYDNVGVQYGLDALKAGEITPAQFADVNAKVGGRDVDYAWQPKRSSGDPGALATLYRSGYVNEATNVDVPIIDLRTNSSVEVHDTYNSFSMRARLDRARGNHANQLIWTNQALSGFVVDPVQEDAAFDLMNRWLDSGRKPADAVDHCTVAGGIEAPCVAPPSGSPRSVAGEPATDDVWKCALKPLDRKAYPVTFTDEEWKTLEGAFPTGVCDYTKPGAGQQATVPWLSYDGGPGGRPATAPRSVAIAPDLGLPSARRCVSRRHFRVRISAPTHPRRLRSVRIYVDGRRRLLLRGRRTTAPVDLRGLRAGRVRVRIVATTTTGRRIVVRRTYRTCTPR